MLSAVRVQLGPEMEPALVMLFVPIAIAPAIVPPAFARYDVEIAEVVARSLKRVPPSWTTLSDANVTTRPKVPVPALDTMLSAVRELTAPERVPTPVMLLVPIAIAPAIVPPAFARYEVATAAVVARSLNNVPPS